MGVPVGALAASPFSNKDEVARVPARRQFVIDGGTAATGMDELSEGIENSFKQHPDDTSYLSVVSYLHIPTVGLGGERIFLQ